MWTPYWTPFYHHIAVHLLTCTMKTTLALSVVGTHFASASTAESFFRVWRELGCTGDVKPLTVLYDTFMPLDDK